MKTKIKILLLIITIVSFASCKKSSIKPSNSSTGTDVYISGYTTALNDNSVAVYWKNGKLTRLSDSTLSMQTTGIAVQGNDVYVSGSINVYSSNPEGILWKNGVATMLPQFIRTTGVAVNGNDVYVVGIANTSTAAIWKNGVMTNLENTSYYSTANAVTVQDGAVYVAGASNSVGSARATYWRNGIATNVPNTTNAITSISVANAMALNGRDIYLAGYAYTGWGGNTVAAYWKNGIVVNLQDASLSRTNSYATGICTNGNDVYVVGYSPNGAMYWKNGTETKLGDGSQNSNAYAITLQGSDIYVVGNDDAKLGATLWKNGVASTFGPVISRATGIAVITH